MAWEKTNANVTFYCDTPDCDSYEIVSSRVLFGSPNNSTFAACWQRVQSIGWRSFKRGGRPWTYHCSACALSAAESHREYNRREQERERIKAQNAY